MDHELKSLSDFAFRQICYGLAWWSASAIAIYNTLSSTGSNVYWFGGCLVALFNWYRGGKAWLAAKRVGVSLFTGMKAVVAIGAIVIAAGSAFFIGPEYLKVDAPSIGTCWAKSDGTKYTPIACWSSEAFVKTIAFSNSEANCPEYTDWIFRPDESDTRFTCLVEI